MSWKKFSLPNNSRETFKVAELCAIQSQLSTVLTTRECESSPVIDVNTSKVESTLTTDKPPRGTLASHFPDLNLRKVETTLITERSSVGTLIPNYPESSDFKKQFIKELKLKLESRKQSQA
jgi:hypothetical protein